MSRVDDLAQFVEWAGSGVRDCDWDAIGRRLGVSMPASFREYVSRFPPGIFQTFLGIEQPRTATDVDGFVERLNNDLKFLRVVVHGDDEFPYGIYPRIPGLLPWGRIDFAYMFCWHFTKAGQPEPRVVMVDTSDGATTEFPGTMVGCIIDILNGRVPQLHYVAEECVPPEFSPFTFAPPGAYRRARMYGDLADPEGLLAVPIGKTDGVGELVDLVGIGRPQVVDWPAVERLLRHPLPGDYKRFIEIVGPGQYGDVTVANPGGPLGDIPGLVELTAEALDELNRDALEPIPLGPVIWGTAPRGWLCGWVPDNYPTDQRPLMRFHPTKYGPEGRGISMTRYLAWHVRDPKDWDASLWLVGEPE